MHNDWLTESITPSAEESFEHTAIMAGVTYNRAQCNEDVASVMTDGFATADDDAFYV